MTESLKILAQLSPSANTLSTLYTVPSSTSAVVSSIVMCNTTSNSINVRVSLASAGAADDIKQYLYYDLPIIANDTFIATIGISLASTDVIRVQASSTGIAFNLLGVEVS